MIKLKFMLSDQAKKKIYALASISVIVFTAASFIITVNFLLKMNNLVFKIDEKLITEKATVLDMDSYNKIKNEIEKQNLKN